MASIMRINVKALLYRVAYSVIIVATCQQFMAIKPRIMELLVRRKMLQQGTIGNLWASISNMYEVNAK
jgi:hypothetical protein